jgi:hypothetical protein
MTLRNDVMSLLYNCTTHLRKLISLISTTRASLCGTSNGVLVNGHVRKHSSMESSDLDLQEKDLDAIPTSSFQERKCSFSSCSSDGFLSSKERFVVLHRMKFKLDGSPFFQVYENMFCLL